MKKVVILGSTGSIGRSALRVAEALPERLKVTGLAVQAFIRCGRERVPRRGFAIQRVWLPRIVLGIVVGLLVQVATMYGVGIKETAIVAGAVGAVLAYVAQYYEGLDWPKSSKKP